MRSVFALGLESNELRIDIGLLRTIFEARNRIIHELDIDFEGARRHRRSRTREHMIDDTNTLLEISERILQTVAQKLSMEPSLET